MAFPTNMAKLTFLFSLSKVGVDQDVAEPGIWVGGDTFGPDSDDHLLSIAEGGFKAWTAHMAEADFCPNVFLSSVTATMYNAAGHTIREQTFVHDIAWVGTDPGPALPWETSLCVSLYSYPRGAFQLEGRRRRGRFYTPPMAASTLDPSNSGFYKDSAIAAFHGRANAFVSDCGKDRLGVQVGGPVVFSRKDGAIYRVIETSMDAKFDSQRRRQNREVAGHAELPVTT